MNLYEALAAATLTLHVVWIGWVLFGWLATRGRPLWRWLHILSLIYGILIEVFLWPCPLTVAEEWFRARAGRAPYQEGFLVHYLQELVYPDVSQTMLTICAVAVCLGILGIYVRRFRRRRDGRW